MSNYLICMDVSGDLDAGCVKNKLVHFLPMEYSVGEEMRTCRGPETRESLAEFYAGQRKGDLTKTSQITPYNYIEYLSHYLKKGYSILYLSLSSGLSATYSSALMAQKILKEDYPEQDVFVVNTYAASGGMGILCERAIRNRDAGMSLEDNYNDVCAAAAKVKHWFLVQDLDYLHRGGRVSGATAMVAGALNIKPVLAIDENGKLVTIAKKRGAAASVKYILSRFIESCDITSGDPVYIIETDDRESADLLEKGVREAFPEAVVRHVVLSPIIGAHTGPGMSAICHMGK